MVLTGLFLIVRQWHTVGNGFGQCQVVSEVWLRKTYKTYDLAWSNRWSMKVQEYTNRLCCMRFYMTFTWLMTWRTRPIFGWFLETRCFMTAKSQESVFASLGTVLASSLLPKHLRRISSPTGILHAIAQWHRHSWRLCRATSAAHWKWNALKLKRIQHVRSAYHLKHCGWPATHYLMDISQVLEIWTCLHYSREASGPKAKTSKG